MLKYIEISKIVFKFDKASALYNAKLNFTLQEKEKEAHLLKEKNKEFEVINEELKQFTYITSHDLKEPIRSLNNYVQLLIRSFKTEINPQQKEYLNYIELFSSRIFALIKDLNQYIQVQEPVEIGQVDLNKTIHILKDNLSLLIKERNVVIKFSKLPEIKAPESHMHDLFLNLLQNAIKYNKSKTPKIKIDSFTSNKEIIISVNDNGIGIPKKNQVEIFEVFKRLHAKTDYEGTGIGLAICKKIVEQNNGRIWVESEENKGSTFFISFLKSKQK
ncbi:MAG: ATP-binding protein [Bacteroidota bacterium]